MSVKKESLRTQDEILKDWNANIQPLVSIRCTTFNHERYIAQCLDGFLKQRTNFPFEIIIHDDASTDSTARIIRQYELDYPLIVKPIYERENQYSKRDNSINRIVNAQIHGKYVAICEGDDYWCDENKLQRAIDFLESHDEYSACAHNTYFENMSKWRRNFIRYPQCDFDVTLRDALNHNSYHTSSIVCRTEDWFSRPDFCFSQPGVGDFPLSVFLTMRGKVRRFGEVMSVYRYGVPGSWQKRVARNCNLRISNAKHAIAMLKEADNWSENRFKDEFSDAVRKLEYEILLYQGRFGDVKKGVYASLWDTESFCQRLIYYFKYYRHVGIRCFLFSKH